MVSRSFRSGGRRKRAEDRATQEASPIRGRLQTSTQSATRGSRPVVTRFVLFDLDNTLFDRNAAFKNWAASFAESRGLERPAVDMLCEADDDGFASRETLFGAARDQLKLPGLHRGAHCRISARLHRVRTPGYIYPPTLERLAPETSVWASSPMAPQLNIRKSSDWVSRRSWMECASPTNSGRRNPTIGSSKKRSAAVAARSPRPKPDGWSETRAHTTSLAATQWACPQCGFPGAACGPSLGTAQISLRRAPPMPSIKSYGRQMPATEATLQGPRSRPDSSPAGQVGGRFPALAVGRLAPGPQVRAPLQPFPEHSAARETLVP